MMYIFYFVLFLISVVCMLWLFICICISCKTCIEKYHETCLTCYDVITKKRAVAVYPIEATEVTYLGGIEIENE